MHSITRLNARRGISIGVTVRDRDGYNGIDFDGKTEIGIGLIKNGIPVGYCIVLTLYREDRVIRVEEGLRSGNELTTGINCHKYYSELDCFMDES